MATPTPPLPVPSKTSLSAALNATRSGETPELLRHLSNATHNASGLAVGHGPLLHNASLTLPHRATPEEIRRSMLVFYIVLFTLLGSQAALVTWRQKHRRSYDLVTLVGLWLVPAFVSFELGFWTFLAVHAVHSAITGQYLWRCIFDEPDRSLPRRVYSWCALVFRLSTAVGALGYALVLVAVLTARPNYPPLVPVSWAFTLLWYGLYFGILTRDAAEVASDRIALVLGAQRRLGVSMRDCALCGGSLPDPAAPVVEDADTLMQLDCKHLFHASCLRGWTIIGKKDTCPTCREKVDLRKLYAERPWETRNLSWIQMLDMVRFFVVWNPLILLGLHLFFHWTGLEKGLPPDAPLAQHDLHNATAQLHAH